MDTSKNIKALTSLVGKPLNVWNASDVDKIVAAIRAFEAGKEYY